MPWDVFRMAKMITQPRIIIPIEDLQRRIRYKEAAENISIAEMERRAGLTKDTIIKLLNKGTEPTYNRFLALMDYLCDSAPLKFALKNGGTVETLTISEGERASIKLPAGTKYTPDMTSMVVEDDSFAPRFFKGDIIFFREGSNTGFQFMKSKYPHICRTVKGETVIAFISAGALPGKYDLVRPDYGSIKNAEIQWCAKIEGLSPSHD